MQGGSAACWRRCSTSRACPGAASPPDTSRRESRRRPQPVLGSSGFSPAYEQFFKDYKAAMQEDFELPAAWRQVLLFRAFNPTKLAYSLAEVWDARFFHGMTFGQLYERER